jgi:large conductance mechanosensitive channel
MLKEFKAFAMRGNMIDMAVGVIVGGAFGKIVASLVNDVLMPPLGLLVGNMDLSEFALVLKQAAGNAKPVSINYGTFINNVINFTIVAFSIFLMVKLMNSLKMEKTEPVPATEKKCPQCCLIIPLEAKRCGHCTSELG